ncbi:DUF4232 domain-containing protein [Archangium sp.]|uniref:DUF4232 domain-containing protein n=1 Tax=Archangium sp. TaxID=1872627 RepID=UPI002D22178A|nr:DUF4232 domain-containing protein [Archangium sp.]HYO53220.1 DUF4232 domain-containing protein [Archangium sp.]
MSNPFRLLPSLLALVSSPLLLVACQGHRHVSVATNAPASENPSGGATEVQPCTSGQLALAEAGSDAGAGKRALHFTLRNTSLRTCTLKGNVGMRLLDASGRPLASVRVEQREDGVQANAASEPVTLSPGGSAWFLLIYPSATGGLQCHAVASVEVTPPSGGSALRLVRGFDVCGTRVTVTPLQAPPTAP